MVMIWVDLVQTAYSSCCFTQLNLVVFQNPYKEMWDYAHQTVQSQGVIMVMIWVDLVQTAYSSCCFTQSSCVPKPLEIPSGNISTPLNLKVNKLSTLEVLGTLETLQFDLAQLDGLPLLLHLWTLEWDIQQEIMRYKYDLCFIILISNRNRALCLLSFCAITFDQQ